MQSGHEAYDFSQDVKLGENRFILFENGEYKLYVDGHFTMAIDENLLSDPAFCEIPIIGGK